MSNELARIFGVLELDWDAGSPLLKLLETGSYEQTLAELLEREKFSDEEWKAAALTHHLVVAWRPEAAHDWLTLVVARLCAEEGRMRQGLHQGSVLGLLEAGVLLDKERYWTKFQKELLLKLVELLCNGKPRKPMRWPHHGARDVDYAGLNKRLVHAMTKFLFPEKTSVLILGEVEPDPLRPDVPEKDMRRQRANETRIAVRYLHEHLGTGELTDFTKQFIERLTHSLLAQKTPAEKVAAVQSVL